MFIARQPIFTRQLDLFGYELLSRTSRENAYHHADPDLASKDGTTATVAADLHLVEIDFTVQPGNEPYRVQTVVLPRFLIEGPG